MTVANAAPPPPPGPGVRPPFVAPPTDGTRQRRWWAIGLATGALVVCCVGGLVGLGGLVVLGNEVVRNEGKAAVRDYLTAIRDENYADAYDLLCPREKRRLTFEQFQESVTAGPALTGFEVAEPVTSDGSFVVPATLRRSNGSTENVRFLLEQESSSGEFKVCGQAS